MSTVSIDKFRAGEVPQKEWGFGGQRRLSDGWILLAFFLGGIGAGQFFISTAFFTYYHSALIGLLFVTIGKTVTHILYLGKPSRFWRIFFRPQTSWISRGLIFMVIFIIFAILYLAPEFGFSWLPWTTSSIVGRMIWMVAAIASFLVMVYDGFLLTSGRSIPSWNTALLPLLFVVYSLGGGVALTSITSIWSGATLSIEAIGYLDTLLLMAILACLGVYMLSIAGSATAARESIRLLVRGKVAPFFVIGAILAGLVIPLILIYMAHSPTLTGVLPVLIAATAVLELSGDLSVRHSILKIGLHTSPV